MQANAYYYCSSASERKHTPLIILADNKIREDFDANSREMVLREVKLVKRLLLTSYEGNEIYLFREKSNKPVIL